MLTDLGMFGDLTEEFLLKIAKDIEESASVGGDDDILDQDKNDGRKKVKRCNNLNGGNDSSSNDNDSSRSNSDGDGDDDNNGNNNGNSNKKSLEVARGRGKRLLSYIKQAENSSDFFKLRLCQKLRIISFIPVLRPVSTQQGGHIVYEPSLSSFDELLAVSAGPLGFSVMPVLDEDIAPPLIFFSSLGVTTSPVIEVVLRHLRNLTVNCGDCLDRWNHEKYTIRDTFSALFSYLSDNWKNIVPPVQDAIKFSQIIPVGHFLVRPARLFFRLQGDDLSPFMHEMPRYFGTHEQFLKEILGIKEQPSASDYIQVGKMKKIRICLSFSLSLSRLSPSLSFSLSLSLSLSLSFSLTLSVSLSLSLASLSLSLSIYLSFSRSLIHTRTYKQTFDLCPNIPLSDYIYLFSLTISLFPPSLLL